MSLPESEYPAAEHEDRPSLRRFAKNSAYGLLTALAAGLGAGFWVYVVLRCGGY